MKKVLLCILLFGVINFASAQPATDESARTKTVVEAFLNELGNKNPQKIAACFAEDIDWYIFESEKFPWTGRRSKRAEVAVAFQTLFSYFAEGKDKFILGSFMVDGNEAALFAQLGRQFKKTGKDFLMHIAIHFTVRDGKIVKFYLYEQTPVLEKAYE